ncbi:MAG: N-acetylmuramoyl-L-alanine amidase [Oscillospiraceae bacterium]|nr:N-acetylmuramoyl-L-alanine amidase [Oscillospiraceae bacterium]
MAKKIYINPGHSDKDPGAVGYETERKLNVAVSKHMNDFLLENFVCETKITPGTMDSLTAICNEANSWGADLFVSIHFNAGGGDGYEALVYSQKRVPLGEIFAKYVKAAGQNLRLYGAAPGVKIRTDLSVLANTVMPAIANEGAFVDNQKDIQDWNDDVELKKLGIAYAQAAAEFLGLEKKVQQKSVYYVRYSTTLGPFADKKTADELLAVLKANGYRDAAVSVSKEAGA